MVRPLSKVFGIGLNKTGTSSLKAALQTLGYRVCGPRRDLLTDFRKGDFSRFDDVVRSYDGFEDVPWPLAFRYLFDRYGDDTRFVLTIRSSPDAWFKSIENHARTSKLTTRTWLLTYGTMRPFGRADEYKALYSRHNAEIREFFTQRGAENRLLELCIDQSTRWTELCRFLGEPVPNIPFPHANRTDLSKKRFIRTVNSCVEPIYRRYVALSTSGRVNG